MARPLIATKLNAPRQRRGLVARPRLDGLLARGAEARLTLVSAPAGFGKTTLLSQWWGQDHAEGRRVAWLSLDAADNDPASFWTGVVATLQASVPGVGPSAMDPVAASPTPTGPELAILLNELAADPSNVWLVLDDYHFISNRDVGEAMAFFLDHLPPQVHLVISTRSDPDLPLALWRGRGELVEIRAEHLRFTAPETAEYLNAVSGLELAPEQVAVLGQRTEGWIAALQLTSISLAGHGDAAGFIDRFAGNDRYVVDYLVEEVLAHQPAPVRDFLLDTCILQRLTGPLCDALSGRSDGDRMLRELERANLFLVPLDEKRQWYRYHQLFADVLRARLSGERPGQVAVLHRRASQWYGARDLWPDAVGHALAAEDFKGAARLMELALPRIRRNRQDALLLGWLGRLPYSVVRRSPVLSVFHGFRLLAEGDLDGVEPRLRDAELALGRLSRGPVRPGPETEELRALPATIAVYRAALAQARGDVEGTSSHARAALEAADPQDHLSLGAASGYLGLAAWAQGTVADALAMFGQAVQHLHLAGNLVDELGSTVVLADMWLAAGRPATARRLCEDALARAEAQGTALSRAAAELHVGLGEIDSQAGNLEAAEGHLLSAAALLEHAPMTESSYRWFVAKALLARAQGEPEEAIALLDQGARLYRRGFFPELRPIAALKARVWIAEGKLQQAAEWAQECGVGTTDEVGYHGEFNQLTLVRLLIARHRVDPGTDSARHAAALLDRLLPGAEASGRTGSVIEIRLLLALAHDALGHRAQARAALARAISGAPEPVGYLRLFLDEGEPLLGLLRNASRAPGAGADIARLLRLATIPGSAPPPASPGLLSERELQVLGLLDSPMNGPRIAAELFISYNTLRTHTKHIFTKLDVTDRRAAVIRARERGML